MTVTCLICIFKDNSFQKSGTNVAQRTLVDGTSSCLPSVSFPTRYKVGLWHTQLLCCYRKQLPHQVALVRSDTSRVSTWTVGIAVYHHVLQVFFFWGGGLSPTQPWPRSTERFVFSDQLWSCIWDLQWRQEASSALVQHHNFPAYARCSSSYSIQLHCSVQIISILKKADPISGVLIQVSVFQITSLNMY